MGPQADKRGTRPVVLFGAVAIGICYLAASFATALWQFYLLMFCAGFFGAAAIFPPIMASIGNWFPIGAGLAIGLASGGQALGSGRRTIRLVVPHQEFRDQWRARGDRGRHARRSHSFGPAAPATAGTIHQKRCGAGGGRQDLPAGKACHPRDVRGDPPVLHLHVGTPDAPRAALPGQRLFGRAKREASSS